jgi:thiamine-monophosphate kinase
VSDEANFLAALRSLARDPAARELMDDAAVLEFGGEALVLTHDVMVEGVHWLAGQDPADIAWKLVAVNLSDLAAKGAEPLGILLGYTLGTDDERFVAGLREVLEHYRVPLLGGDTVAGPGPATHGVTVIGRASFRPVPSRAGARPGDTVWLTGPLGAAMLGFEALRDGNADRDTSAFRRPAPRLAEGRALAPLVTAMMDVSDGLLLDSTRLAQASNVTLAFDSGEIPLAPGVRENDRGDDALRWGDDYELLFTLPHRLLPPGQCYRIGEVAPPRDAAVLLDGAPPDCSRPLGFIHAAPR